MKDHFLRTVTYTKFCRLPYSFFRHFKNQGVDSHRAQLVEGRMKNYAINVFHGFFYKRVDVFKLKVHIPRSTKLGKLYSESVPFRSFLCIRCHCRDIQVFLFHPQPFLFILLFFSLLITEFIAVFIIGLIADFITEFITEFIAGFITEFIAEFTAGFISELKITKNTIS